MFGKLGCGEEVCCVNVLSVKHLQINLDAMIFKVLIIRSMLTWVLVGQVACLLPLVFSRTPLAIIATGLGWSSMLVIALGFTTAHRLSCIICGCPYERIHNQHHPERPMPAHPGQPRCVHGGAHRVAGAVGQAGINPP